MGRSKVYADKAEKMRAYRARRAGRVVEVDRPAMESMEERLRRLRAAVNAAKEAGSKEAAKIDTITLEDTIEGVIALFGRLSDAMPAHLERQGKQEAVPAVVSDGVKPTVDRVAQALKGNVTFSMGVPQSSVAFIGSVTKRRR